MPFLRASKFQRKYVVLVEPLSKTLTQTSLTILAVYDLLVTNTCCSNNHLSSTRTDFHLASFRDATFQGNQYDSEFFYLDYNSFPKHSFDLN